MLESLTNKGLKAAEIKGRRFTSTFFNCVFSFAKKMAVFLKSLNPIKNGLRFSDCVCKAKGLLCTTVTSYGRVFCSLRIMPNQTEIDKGSRLEETTKEEPGGRFLGNRL